MSVALLLPLWLAAAATPPAPAEYAREAASLEAYLWRHVLEPRFPRSVDEPRATDARLPAPTQWRDSGSSVFGAIPMTPCT